MVTGTGAPGQVTFWTGNTTVSGDASFVWDPGTRRLLVRSGPIAPETSAAMHVQSEPSAALFAEGNQLGQGSNARALAVADGALGAPVAAAGSPTLVVQRVDASEGPLIPFQFTVRRTAAGGGDLYALHSHATSESENAGDVVGLTGFAYMTGEGPPPTGFRGGFGVWGAANRTRTGSRLAGAEFNVNNSSGTDAADPRLPPCVAADCDPRYHDLTYGVIVAGLGNAKNSAGVVIGAHAAAARFKTGIQVTDAVADGGIGVDLADMAPAAKPLRIRNSTFVYSTTNDPARFPADLRVIGVAGFDNSLRILNDDIIIMPPDEQGGQGGRRVLLSPGGAANGPVGVGTVTPALDATLEVDGGQTKGLRLVPRNSPAPPATPNSVGTLAVTSQGVLYIMTPTGWVKVGAQ